MKYTTKSKEEKQAEIKALINDAQNKINSYFESSDSMKEYLNFMSKFYSYSLNNCSLIEHQFPGAMAVAPYKTWQEKGFKVNKGEKAIKILVPCKAAKRFENEDGEVKPVTKATPEERIKIKNGTYEVSEGRMYFMKGNVFDISQTNAKAEDLPKIFPNKWLEGDVKDYKLLRKALENVANSIGVKIIEPVHELGAAKGVSYTNTKEVALNPRNSELQNIKTLVHELTHAKLHTIEKLGEYEAYEKEFQAELTAYTVCRYVGLDTSEYSINYLHSWTKDKTFEDKKKILKEVHETSREFITIIEDTLISERKKLNERDNNISYYVCECMEFENLANRYDDIQTIEEAINIYNNIPANLNMGSGIGILVNDEPYALYQNANVDTLEFYPDEIVDLIEVQDAIGKLKNEFENTVTKKSTSKEVAVESTDDIEYEENFHYSNGAFGRKDYYRIVEINNEGLVKQYNDMVFESRSKAAKYIIDNQEIKEISYDSMIHKADEIYLQKQIEIEKMKEGLEKMKEFELVKDLNTEDGLIKRGTNFIVDRKIIDDKQGMLYELHFDNAEAGDGYFVNSKKLNEILKNYSKEAYSYYVIEDLKENNIKIGKGLTMADAIKKYNELDSKNKALGIAYSNGELDLVHNVNGKDKILQDFKYSDVLKNNPVIDQFIDTFNIYKEYGKAKCKVISKERANEIEQMIKAHEKWVESNGLTGEKLVLNNENLNGFKFYECDLRYAEIKNCDLTNCVFYADMTNTTFMNNKISGTKWIGSDITEMKTDKITKTSISQTLENNKIHDVMAEKLKDKKKKEKEYAR